MSQDPDITFDTQLINKTHKMPPLLTFTVILLFLLLTILLQLCQKSTSSPTNKNNFLCHSISDKSMAYSFKFVFEVVSVKLFLFCKNLFCRSIYTVMLSIILVLLLCDTLAHYLPGLEPPNVGSVLFTTDDLDKKLWSNSNIQLLRIRKYIQNVLPPTGLVDTVSEEYIVHLLSYFQDAYATIKREIDSPSLQEMMEVALSDTLGGYIKVWILPVTKYAYYGGSISLDSALNVLELYENLRTKLNTDGQSWRSPNNNLLNYVAINIALPEHIYTRSMSNPCKDLAYYEKTDKGLTLPVPHINWNISPSTMFLPLKNQSLVPLNSVNSSKSLLRYYDLAKTCMQTQNPESLNDFDERFQLWLIKDVIPHLNDSDFYVTFGSILSLLNKTNKIDNNFVNVCHPKSRSLQSSAILHGIPFHFTTKKMLIIGIVLFLEIIWCIPTLLYIIFSNKKKRNTQRYCFTWVKSKYYKQSDYFYCASDEMNEEIKEIGTETNIESKPIKGIKLLFKPNFKNSEVRTHTRADRIYPFKSMFTVKDRLSESDKSSNNLNLSKNSQKMENSVKKSVSKVSNKITKPPEDKTIFNIENERKSNGNTDSQSCVTTVKRGSVISNKKESEITIKQISHPHVNEKLSSVTSKTNQKDEKPDITKTYLPRKSSKDKSIDQINLKKESVKKIKEPTPKKKDRFISQLPKKKHTAMTHLVSKSKKETKDNEQNNKKTEKSLLRIQIERPKTEIQLGITTYKEYSSAPQKPSKIPKRSIVTSCEGNKDSTIKSPRKEKKLKEKEDTKIITRSLDDSNIVTNIQPDKTKLNISF